MQRRIVRRTIKLSAMTLAIATAFAARAEFREPDDVVLKLIKPESAVALGLGYLWGDNQRYGQYTGLTQEGWNLDLDLDLVKRDDATGTWWLVRGHDLGRDSRDLRVEHTRQGDWSYYLEYAELLRQSQYTVNTGLGGIDTNRLTINGTGMRDFTAATRRESVAVGGGKTLPAGWDVTIRFKNEEKDGTRLFGRGTPGTQQFLAEPIEHTMQQLDVVLGFTGKKFQMQTGYYGSYFRNRNSALFVDDPSGDPSDSKSIASFSPLGLPPDNYAHQLYVTGGYNFTPTTRGTFKASETKATQQDKFFLQPAATIGDDNLDGEVDTTLLQAGITSRPTPRLFLLGNLRYMDRDDQTPIRQYFSTGGKTYDGNNEPRSVESTVGKAEATYRLGGGYSLLAGFDYEGRKRNTSPVRVVSFRERTDERGYRVQLKRMMSETVNGAISLEHSDRDGSDFQTTVLSDGSDGSNLVAPIHLADRERDKLKLTADWTPIPAVSMQALLEASADHYRSRDLGPREGNSSLVSVDATYAFNDFWKGSAWFLRNDTRLDQATQNGTNQWQSHTRYQDRAYGLSVKGTIAGKLEIGADFSEANNDGMFLFASSDSSIDSLPDVNYQTQTIKAYARYQMRKDLALRFDLVHQRWETNDWQWADYVYSDGTTLSQDPDQNVMFVGVTAIVSWR